MDKENSREIACSEFLITNFSELKGGKSSEFCNITLKIDAEQREREKKFQQKYEKMFATLEFMREKFDHPSVIKSFSVSIC